MSLSVAQESARTKVREGLALQHRRGPYARPWSDKEFLRWLRGGGFDMSRFALSRARDSIYREANEQMPLRSAQMSGAVIDGIAL